jgi:aarF domain-containing kinase
VVLQGLDEAAAQADASATHTRIAERMRDLALENGGIFVKGGQHICAQPIIPPEYVVVLRTLMSHAQHHPLEDDERTFEEDTHVKLRDAFAEFDPKPVASASLAQVYRARLRDGRAVAVKIQQRPVARFLAVDLATIEGFYSLLATLIPGLRLGWLAEETRRHMQEELDFIAEAANAKRVSALLSEEFPRDQVLIPDTHPELCGPRVLVMDWVDGVRIDDTHGLARLHADVPALATRLQKVFGAMTFCHGFVHCDPVRGLWEPNSVCTSLC